MMAPEPTNQKTNTSHSVGVSVTTKTESTPIGDGLELNPSYFLAVPGILKIIQLVCAIICMGCASPALADYTRFFMFVVVLFFIATLIFCLVYFFSVKKLLSKLPWLLIELMVAAAAVVLYFIAMVTQLAMTSRADYKWALSNYGVFSAYIAAGVFSLFNTIAYGAGLFFLFMEYKASRPATTITTTTTTNGAA